MVSGFSYKTGENVSLHISDIRSQLLKGVLDMCLLAIISEEPSYGYEMADKLIRYEVQDGDILFIRFNV